MKSRAGLLGPGLRGLLFSRRWPREKLLRYQGQRLRSIVGYACREVPFYRDLYRKHGVKADDIRGLEDLAKLPVISRSDLQEFDEKNLRAQGLGVGSVSEHWTSGSTGEPLRVWRTRLEDLLLSAFRGRALLWYGLRPWERLVSVNFLPEESRPMRKPGPMPIRRLLFPHLEIHCLLETEKILNMLSLSRPRVIAGLPPILDRICESLEAAGRTDIAPRMIVSGAEILTAQIRRALVRQFGAPVYDRYSALECRLAAFSCPRHPERYHLCEDAVLAEVVKDGRPARAGEEGEILITALHSYAMPFIRYRLGDVVRLGEGPCSCGAPYAVLSSIRGRIVDRLVDAGGAEIHIPMIVQIMPELAPWIRRYRIVQKRPGQITIEVFSGRDAGPEGVAETLRRIKDRIRGLDVSLEIRADSAADETGKFRLFRSDIQGMQSETK